MVSNSEIERYERLKAKCKKMEAQLDIIEQENAELKKENKGLKNDITKLQKNNEKVLDISNNKFTTLYNEIAKLNAEVIESNRKKKECEETIKTLNNTIESLNAIIENLKSQKMKNSTNSSKPSSTNGFKKVIQNNRVKTGKSKGGQKGREGKTLNKVEKVDEVIDVYGKEVCECGGVIVYEELEYIEKQLIDLANDIKVLGYRFHKGKCQKCGKEYQAKVPVELANPVQYSNNIKTIVPIIRNISNMSVETTKKVFSSMFKGLTISDGWIHKQDKIISEKCKPVIEKIIEYLSMSDVAYADETGVDIGDKLGSCICFSNERAVIYDMFPNKSQKDSFDEFELFNKYSGILMHDHNKTYYKYMAMEHAECNVHITRYLNAVTDLFKRKGAKKLKEYLLKIYKEKLDAITEGKEGFTQDKIKDIEEEYLNIIEEWEKEYKKYISTRKRITKPLKEEKCLFTRLREYKEEHLRFIKNFAVPFSNNESERNLRKIKIKLNTSKRFGELTCAKDYAIIKSIIETAKKQGKDILNVFIEILNGNTDVFDLSYINAEN